MCWAEHTYGRNNNYIVLVAGNRRGNLLQLVDAGWWVMLKQILYECCDCTEYSYWCLVWATENGSCVITTVK